MTCKIDHFVIAAASLDQGVAYVRSQLGVEMPYGGEHPKMGTHNHLMRIGPDVFLEVIAINPDMVSQRQFRWFDLDNPTLQDRLKLSPQLLTWVVRTDFLQDTLARLPLALGETETLTRDSLTWQMVIHADGSLVEEGVIPLIIEWPKSVQPWNNMVDLGCEFKSFTLCHPETAKISAFFEAIQFHDEKVLLKESDAKGFQLEIEIGGKLVLL